MRPGGTGEAWPRPYRGAVDGPGQTRAPGVRAVLLDAGDTLVDEATQVTVDGEIVAAELIPGAAALVEAVAGRWPLALVADGPRSTFANVLGRQHGLLERFDALAISGDVGVEKPDPAMFATALDALGVARTAWETAVMVGNNLRRDVAGAKALGLTTVWIDWAPRRRKVPRTDLERPDHAIAEPLELLAVLEALDAADR